MSGNEGAIAQALKSAAEKASGSDAAKIVGEVIAHDSPAHVENGRSTETIVEEMVAETLPAELTHEIIPTQTETPSEQSLSSLLYENALKINPDGTATLITDNADGSTTQRVFTKEQVFEALTERTSQKRMDDDERRDRMSHIMQELAEAALEQYGMIKLADADVLHLITERQLINDYIKALFETLGVPVHFLQVLTKGVRTAFGRKVLDMPSFGQACRQAMATYRQALEDADRARAEKQKMEAHYNAEIQNAESASRQARLTLEAATRERAEIKSEITSFNMPSDEKPFILRGHYFVPKKVLGRVVEGETVRRVVYIGVKNGAKKKGDYYLSKDLFATSNLKEAMRMNTTKEAVEYVRRLMKKMKADEINPESGITQKKLNALTVTRISFDAMNVTI